MHKFCFLIVAAASGLICSGSVQGEHHEKAATLLRSNFLSVDVDQSGALDKKEFKEFVIANSKADIGPFPMPGKPPCAHLHPFRHPRIEGLDALWILSLSSGQALSASRPPHRILRGAPSL